ncbi:MAG: 4-hydroxy-3-methylbut-2-enyl diphosphate reductase, partial [Rhodospirillaceae bacterium]
LDGVNTVGISAGASAPEDLVQELVKRLAEYRPITVEVLDGIEENVHFKLPEELEDVGSLI